MKDNRSPATTTDHPPHGSTPSEPINAADPSKGGKISGATEADLLLLEIRALFRQLPVDTSNYTRLHEVEKELDEKHKQVSAYVDLLQLAGATTRRGDFEGILQQLSDTHQLVYRLW